MKILTHDTAVKHELRLICIVSLFLVYGILVTASFDTVWNLSSGNATITNWPEIGIAFLADLNAYEVEFPLFYIIGLQLFCGYESHHLHCMEHDIILNTIDAAILASASLAK